MRLVPIAIAAVLLASPALAVTAYPLTVQNCGVEVNIPKAPERVVTIKSTATELLL